MQGYVDVRAFSFSMPCFSVVPNSIAYVVVFVDTNELNIGVLIEDL